MLVTPWFAAGAGFVIAAALALNSPHTVLTYRPRIVPCAGSGCAEPGAMPTTRPNVQLKRVKPAPVTKSHSAGPGPGAGSSAGPKVGFQVVGHHDGEFTAIVTIPGQQARHGWRLSFRFPGRHVTQVFGALWSPSASGDGGTATILAPQHSGPGRGHHNPPGRQGGSGGSGSGDNGGSGWPGSSGPAGQGAAGPNSPAGRAGAGGEWPLELRFLVTVQGDPVTPVGCVLNQHACHFG